MIYAMLWLETVAACVLWVLWGFACWKRYPNSHGFNRAAAIVTTIFTTVLCLVHVAGSLVLYTGNMEHNYLFYSVSLVVTVFVLLVVLLRRGLRKDGEQSRLLNWPLARLGIAAAASTALYCTTLMTTDTTMQMKLANVRLEAGALAMSEAPPRPVERENAAILYARVFERLDGLKNSELLKAWNAASSVQPPLWTEANMDASRPELRDYLARNKGTLELLRRAAAMPACAFDRTFVTPSPSMMLPELSRLRECARILAIDARCRAADGDFKGALENLRAINGIAEHLSYEPVLISGMVSVSCYGIGMETLEAILRNGEPAVADIEAGWNADEFFSFRRVYKRSMRGERAFGLSAFALFCGPDGPNLANAVTSMNGGSEDIFAHIGAPLAGIMIWRVYLLPYDLRGYNDTMESMEQVANMSFKDGKASLDALQDFTKPRPGILTSLLVPALSRSFELFHSAEARVRLTALARAVSLYRAKNKAFPKDLSALVPDYISDIPADPFDDKPLRMKTHAAGVTLYSIGTNIIDDGGAPPTKQLPYGNDLVLRIGKVGDAATTPAVAHPALPGPPKTGF